MDRSLVAVVLAGVLIAAAGAAVLRAGDAPTGRIAERVSELSSGQEVEILSVEDRGTFDKVVLRPEGSDRVTDLYITADGEYILRDPVPVANFTRRVEGRNAFLDCLDGRNATFYAIMTSNASFARHTRMAGLQFEVLGGARQAGRVFGGPGEGAVREAVARNGVVWWINGSYLPGLRTIGQLERLSGCDYTVDR